MGSNHRHRGYEPRALPLSYTAQTACLSLFFSFSFFFLILCFFAATLLRLFTYNAPTFGVLLTNKIAEAGLEPATFGL
jgi:hypothetical protein